MIFSAGAQLIARVWNRQKQIQVVQSKATWVTLVLPHEMEGMCGMQRGCEGDSTSSSHPYGYDAITGSAIS